MCVYACMYVFVCAYMNACVRVWVYEFSVGDQYVEVVLTPGVSGCVCSLCCTKNWPSARSRGASTTSFGDSVSRYAVYHISGQMRCAGQSVCVTRITILPLTRKSIVTFTTILSLRTLSPTKCCSAVTRIPRPW